MDAMTEPVHQGFGFDYAQAIKDLLKKFTYSEIVDRLGYRSVGSLTAILDGKIPSHMHGEALWVLYRETYGRKPPLMPLQIKANF